MCLLDPGRRPLRGQRGPPIIKRSSESPGILKVGCVGRMVFADKLLILEGRLRLMTTFMEGALPVEL